MYLKFLSFRRNHNFIDFAPLFSIPATLGTFLILTHRLHHFWLVLLVCLISFVSAFIVVTVTNWTTLSWKKPISNRVKRSISIYKRVSFLLAILTLFLLDLKIGVTLGYTMFAPEPVVVTSYPEKGAIFTVDNLTGMHALSLIFKGTDPTFTSYTDVSALFSNGIVKKLLWNKTTNKWLVLK